MEQIWKEMFQAAKAVQNGRQISDYVDTGGLLLQYYHHQKKYTWVFVWIPALHWEYVLKEMRFLI